MASGLMRQRSMTRIDQGKRKGGPLLERANRDFRSRDIVSRSLGSLSLYFLHHRAILVIGSSQGRRTAAETSWPREVRKRKESCRVSTAAIARERERERSKEIDQDEREEAENLCDREASDSRCKKTGGKGEEQRAVSHRSIGVTFFVSPISR